MKKYIRYISIVPVLLLTVFFFWGCSCSEPRVQSISISITESENVTFLGGNRYEVVWDENNPYVEINASIYPTGFSVGDLEWTSSSPSIATFMNKNKGLLTCIRDGSISVTASLQGVSSTIFIEIVSASSTRFPSSSVQSEYTGYDQKDSYLVINPPEDEENYTYSYFDNSTGERVNEIKNVGEYDIVYYRVETDEETSSTTLIPIDQMSVTITPYKIIQRAEDGSSLFGASLQSGFYSSTDITNELILEEGEDIVLGVGEDDGEVIGKYVYSSSASQGDIVGTYYTNFEYVLFDEYKNNYEVTTTSGLYIVSARSVVLKVEDQNITYMSSPIQEYFSLYDYNEYVANNNSILGISPLSNEEANYLDCIQVTNYTYYQNNEEKTTNEWGYLNAGTYDITYTSPTANNNLSIQAVLSGEIVVGRKPISVTPTSNLSKVYGEEDDLSALAYTTSSSVITQEIKPFLNINYMLSLESDFVLTPGNSNAPVGTYYYSIDNLVNPNYNFTLVEEATPEYEDEDSKIVFRVTEGNISILFEGYSGNFISPKNGTEHVVSYYNNVSADFITKITSFKINDQEMVNTDGTLTCISEDFESTGMFVLETGEKFRVSLRLLPDITQDGYYETYKIGFSSSYYEIGLETNYTINVLPSYINLSKITLTITPSTKNASKIYDNTSDLSGINNFLSSYSVSGSIEEGVSIDQIVTDKTLLTLINEDGYYIRVDGEREIEEQSFRNAGVYKVFLSSNIIYQTGREYYEFVLDESQEYYFTVEPKDIVIIPNEDQAKYYGASDPVLGYEIDLNTEVYGDGSLRDGMLSREPGENVGEYEINLGSLSFGENYSLSVKPGVIFTINKRDITVTPYSYTTTYGSSEPSSISYELNIDIEKAGIYDENILVEPEFTGDFDLQYENVNVSKIGGYYPVVFDQDGDVASYTITQGGFNLTEESLVNYNLAVTETSTFTVQPKDITINIVSRTMNSEDIKNPPIVLQENQYSLTPSLVSGTSISITVNNVVNDEPQARYLIDSINDLSISLSVSGVATGDLEKIQNSYKFSLGDRVLYYVNSVVISLKLVARGTNESVVERTYNGKSMADEFVLMSTNSEFVLSDESTYTIDYSTTSESGITPINVGGYNVSVKIEEGQSLVLEKKNDGSKITFTSFGIATGGYIATVSQYGYLMISRATIGYNNSLVGFSSALTYGNGVDDLSNILEERDGEKVFSGVSLDENGGKEEISLYVQDGKNFEYVNSSSPIEMLSAGITHYITVRVRAANEQGEINGNYAPLIIEVPLKVDQRQIIISSLPPPSFESPAGDEAMVYNGTSMYYTLKLTADNNNYSLSYRYILLETEYSDSSAGTVLRYTTNGNSVSPMLSEDDIQLALSIAELQNMISVGVTIQNIGGSNYLVVNSESGISECYRVAMREDVTPRNAGIYVCFATCSSNSNYILSYEDNVSGNIEFSVAFEIQKSGNITVENWKEDFYYGTIFNIGNESTLPFEYTMSPNYKDDVEYVTNNYEEWAEVNFILGVGNYSITLIVNNDNYYFSNDLNFNVNSLEAEFIFPSDNRFVYRDEPIISFLSDISVVLKDMNGNNVRIVEYEEDVASFHFEYYNEDGSLCEGAPSDVGIYSLHATYGAKTEAYFGEGKFEYEIVKRAYTGYVRANDISRPYNPSYTARDIYGFMLSMFDCSESSQNYTLTIVDDNNPQIVFSANDESWVKNINDCSSPKRIRFIMTFNDGVTANREIRANLTFTRIAVTSASLQIGSTMNKYNYTGYPVYKELVYNGVDLSPGVANTTKQVTSNGATYTLEYGENYRVTLRDGLGNLIFTIGYNYSYYTSDTDYTATSIPPTSPSEFEYRVDYEIVSFGTNYERNISSISPFEFYINKINNIYINMSTFQDVTYTGQDLSDIIKSANIRVSTEQGSSPSNMKVTILYNPSLGSSISYTEEQGVCLVVRYMDEEGHVVTELKNAGKYTIVLSLLYLPGSYQLNKYFDYVCFGNASPISVNDFIEASDLIYNYNLKTTLRIIPAESLYDDENFMSAFDVEGEYNIVKDEALGNILEFYNDTKIELKSDVPFSIKFYQGVQPLPYTSFSELPGPSGSAEYAEYRFVIYDEEGNYSNSVFITIRKTANNTSGV